jgi:hypothetical protein
MGVAPDKEAERLWVCLNYQQAECARILCGSVACLLN